MFRDHPPGRGVRLATLAAGLACFAASGRAHAQSCTMTFNTYSVLAALPHEAADSFAYAPFYGETCGQPNSGWNPIFRVTPLGGWDHYHLGFEDPTFTCYITNVGLGRMVNGRCTAPADYAAQPRSLSNHGLGEVLQIATEPRDEFDLTGITVKTGSPQVTVQAWASDGSGWQWFLGPGTWSFSAHNRWLDNVQILASDGESSFIVDDVVVEPAFSTHQVDSANSLGYWDGDDWAYGAFKATCEDVKGLVGISSDVSSGRAHSVRCRNHLYWAVNSPPATVSLTGGDSRRATDTGDWDVGYTKAECNDFEVVAGVSENPSNGQLASLMCASTSVSGPSGPGVARSCVARPLNTSGTAVDHVDWAYGFYKTECADDEVMKGVSRNGSGGVHKILCCQYPNHVL